MKKIYIIVGPTASGKSEFGINLAKKLNGAIINADSMQVYKDLEIITASPSKDEKNIVPHYGYNHISPEQIYSVAHYLEDLRDALANAENNGSPPIMVGGTGMYINAALEGLSQIPEINLDTKNLSAEIMLKEGLSGLYKKLSDLDPDAASKLNKNDTQRIIRAFEVKIQTGNSIHFYQKTNSEPLLKNYDIEIFYLKPERKFLHTIIESRLERMFEAGVLDEVKKFTDIYNGITQGAAKAVGFKEIVNYLEGNDNIESLKEKIVIKTRQYAKRQFTWFNNSLKYNHKLLEFSTYSDYKNTLLSL